MLFSSMIANSLATRVQFLSVAAFNFFFTEPRFSFQADSPSYPVTFLIMLFSSMIANSLATRVQEQARLAAQKSYYTELLLESSQKLQQCRTEWECLHITAKQLNRLFDRPILYALSRKSADLSFRAEPSEDVSILSAIGPEELGIAQWVQRNNKHAGATTHTLPNAKWLFLSVRGTHGVMGIVGIPIVGYPLPDAFDKNLMISMLSQCGLAKWLFLSVRGTHGVMGIVGIPIVGYPLPDAFDKNLMISMLSQCGLSQERIYLQEEQENAAPQT